MAEDSFKNHDPKVVLFYFLETVEDVRGVSHVLYSKQTAWCKLCFCAHAGCQTQIRSDHSTENGLVAATQISFRSNGILTTWLEETVSGMEHLQQMWQGCLNENNIPGGIPDDTVS